MGASSTTQPPKPKPKHWGHSERKEDFDDILKDVACFIRGNAAIDTLGKALGFAPAKIERYIATNTRYQHVTCDGTLKMLRDWRDDQTKETERPVLADALRLAGLERLADTFLMTPTVPDLQPASNDLSPEGDLLGSVVIDIMKYYIFNMCTVLADPINNDAMFEFDHIYTNPTLLEQDRNDKKIRKPLLYCNLLKTKINGHIPNRLLVQAGGGAGKTTFCSKIAWDWVHGLGFQQFKLVAVIPLRKAKNKTVGDVIKSYLPHTNPVTAVQIDNYILHNPKDVFLVFDSLDELDGNSDLRQIFEIILNRIFISGTVLVTSRKSRVDEILSITELKKVYASIYLEGFSVDNVAAYITKFFNQDTASSQELIDFITSNDVIADNMAPFPIYIAMLCIMWREYDGERREAMSKLMTFSQLITEMVDLLVDHYGSKDDSQASSTVEELRMMIPNHLKVVGEIAFQGILDRRLEFSEDAFQNCRDSMEMCCKVGVLTREKHATPRRDRLENRCLQTSKVQFTHKLFQEFMAAKYLASLHSSDHDRYQGIMADIIEKKEEFRHLLYFTSAQGGELGLDIVTRLIAQITDRELSPLYPILNKLDSVRTSCSRIIYQKKKQYDTIFHKEGVCNFTLIPVDVLLLGGIFSGMLMSFLLQEKKENFLVDIAYESQHQSVAEKVGNQFMRSWKTLEITQTFSAHTLSGFLYMSDHLDEVDSLVLEKECGRKASQDLAGFILSSASLRTMEIGEPMHAVFYSMLADKAQQCQIQNLKIYMVDLRVQPLPSRDLAKFISQMPHLKRLELYHNVLHKEFFVEWTSIVSSAKGNNQSTPPHTSLRELRANVNTVLALQSCGDMFDDVQKLCFWYSRDIKFDFLQRVHGFQGVTELTFDDRFDLQPYPVTGKPSIMIKHLARVFPQLFKLTFRIYLGNATLKHFFESLRETRGLPLKSVRIQRPEMDDCLDELDALIVKINKENVFRVEVDNEREYEKSGVELDDESQRAPDSSNVKNECSVC